MKRIFWILSVLLLSCSSTYAQQDQYNDNSSDDVYYNDNSNYNEQQSDNDGMSYQTFYDQLSPYGSWIDYPGYGYVWVPQANSGFTPYESDGRWVYTDYGWTWASDYPWGWATFHYGRWFQDPDYGGWMWMPGYDWAPAWVTWGSYGGYYCWAPIGPRGYVNSRYGDHYGRHWSCLPQGRMGDAAMGRYVVSNTVVNHDAGDFERNVHIVNHTNTYNHSVFSAGPKAEEVQKVVGHPIERVAVNNIAKPAKTEIHGNKVDMYRPAISKSNTANQRAVPANISRPSETNNGAVPNRAIQQGTNPNPARSEPARIDHSQSKPAGSFDRSPTNNSWTPPRQSSPARSEPQQAMPRSEPQQIQRSEPMQQSRPSGGFIPAERPVQQSMPRSEPMPQMQRSQPMQQSMPRSQPMQSAPRSMPAPSFHAPAGGGRH